MFVYNFDLSVGFNLNAREVTIASARMSWGELCYVPNDIIHYDPAVVCARVLLDLVY
jgi:hypothetical protein